MLHYRQDAAKRQAAGIKFTHRPKIRFFAPQGRICTDSGQTLRGATGTWVRLAVQNFTSIATGGGNAAPKCQKFSLFGKESLDRFLKFLGVLYA